MTKKQRLMIWKWCAAAVLLLPLIIFDDYVAANASWLRWVLFPFLIIAAAFERPTLGRIDAGQKDFNRRVDEMPWLKVWAAVCATICFGGAIYITRSPHRLEELFGFKVIVIAFVVVLGPIIVAIERRRFKECGETMSSRGDR